MTVPVCQRAAVIIRRSETVLGNFEVLATNPRDLNELILHAYTDDYDTACAFALQRLRLLSLRYRYMMPLYDYIADREYLPSAE